MSESVALLHISLFPYDRMLLWYIIPFQNQSSPTLRLQRSRAAQPAFACQLNAQSDGLNGGGDNVLFNTDPVCGLLVSFQSGLGPGQSVT